MSRAPRTPRQLQRPQPQRPEEAEAEFQKAVVDLFTLRGWLGFHVYDSRKTLGRGFPDWVLVHPTQKRLAFVELKRERGRLSADQRVWLAALQAIPVIEVYVWRPSDWRTIEQTLTAQRGAA